MKLFVAFGIIIFLTSCNHTPNLPPKTLRIAIAADPTTIDPRRSGDFVSSTLICLLYEGLTRCKSGSDVELALAEKVEISPDGKTYLFYLRNSFWTDGQKVTAYDFEKSWKTILQPGFPALCAYLFYPILNAESYAKGLCEENQVGIHAINAQTLKVTLEHPTPYFLSLTAFPLYRPTPSHVSHSPSPYDTPVCNGPFVLEARIPGAEIVLKKNPHFWNPDLILLEKIHISIIPHEMTSLQLFEKGELDLVGGPLTPMGIESLPLLKRDFPLHFLPMAASTFCSMNTQTYPFSNQKLRKAFSAAIQNHPAIMGEIEQNGQIPAHWMLPPSLSLCQNLQNPSELNITAQEWLTAALEEMGIAPKDLDGLTLYYKTNPLEKKIAQTLQKIWKETLRIHIQIEQMEPKSLSQRLYAKNYQLSLASWIAQFHDPINILERFKEGTHPKNYPGWANPSYRQILDQAACLTNQEERLQSLLQAEKILQEEAMLIPLYHWSSPLMVHPRVQGFTTTTSGGVLLEKCSIVEAN